MVNTIKIQEKNIFVHCVLSLSVPKLRQLKLISATQPILGQT